MSLTAHHASGIIANPITAYTNHIRAFLKSSSFPLDEINLNQKYKKTQIAINQSIVNKKSFT